MTLTVQCPKGIVGRIIGKGGETIKGLQRKYHVSIQIDQGGDPMNVTITGPKQTAEYCKQEVQSLINDPGPPFGGPGERTDLQDMGLWGIEGYLEVGEGLAVSRCCRCAVL